MHRAAVALGLAIALGGVSAPLDAASLAQRAVRGKAVLADNCARCHALGSSGDSPMAAAPPMRTIYERFSPRELQAELAEGMVSHYAAMPQIQFSDEDVDAILAYLYSLSVQKRRSEHPRGMPRK